MSNTATAANRMVSTLRASLRFIIFLLPLAECFPIDRRASRRSGKRVQLIPHASSEDIDVGVRVLIGDYADVERSGVGERADTERHVADEVQQREHIEQPRPGEVERPFGTGEVGALHVHPLTDYGLQHQPRGDAAVEQRPERSAAPRLPIVSSSEDMARYPIAHLNEGRYDNTQILSAAGMDELHHPAVDAKAMGISFGQYGMGWIIEETGRTKFVWHSGTCPDFFAYMAILPEQEKGVILLVNANHLMMDKMTFTEVGASVAKLLAGEEPVPSPFVGAVPWALRALPLIPAIQIVGVAATLRRLLRWHQDPSSHSLGGRKWGRYILLPLIPDLLVSLPLVGLLWTSTLDVPLLGMLGSGFRDVLLLFMPDVSWIALVCGSFALAWMFVRTGLVLRSLRKPSLS